MAYISSYFPYKIMDPCPNAGRSMLAKMYHNEPSTVCCYHFKRDDGKNLEKILEWFRRLSVEIPKYSKEMLILDASWDDT